MSRNFSGIPSANYKGIFNPQPLSLCAPPTQKPMACKVVIDWSLYGAPALSTVSVALNLPQQVMDQLGQIGSIYIDNTGSQNSVYVQASDTQFTITASAHDASWYPVISQSDQFLVVCSGIVAGNVPTTTLYFANRQIGPSSDPEINQSLNLSLASPIIGGGAPLATGVVSVPGQSYLTGAGNFSGGGGTGATGHGTLDGFGRFTGLQIDSGGAGYSGPATFTPSGANPARPAFVPTTSNQAGTIVTANGTEWSLRSFAPSATGAGAPAYNNGIGYSAGTNVTTGGNTQWVANATFGAGNPPGTPGLWTSLGNPSPSANNANFVWQNSGSPGGQLATAQGNPGVPASAIVSQGYGTPALGDQLAQAILPITANNTSFSVTEFGPFPAPYFAMITAYSVVYAPTSSATDTGGTYDVRLRGAANGDVMQWLSEPPITLNGATRIPSPGVVDTIAGINFVLDASDSWELITVLGTGNAFQYLAFKFFFTLTQRQL